MGESRVNFSKVIKGTQKPFKATIYVERLGGEDYDCTLTELEFEGKKKIDGLEQNLKLEGPIKYTPESKTASSGTVGKEEEDEEDEEEDDRDFERTFVSHKGGATGGGDDEEGEEEYTVDWEKLVFKQFGNGYEVQEEMAWVSLGEKGENVLTTDNWKD